MTEENSWLQSQLAIEGIKALTRWSNFDNAIAPATTEHRLQVAGGNERHE